MGTINLKNEISKSQKTPTENIGLRVTKFQKEEIDSLAKGLNCSRAELLRVGLALVFRAQQGKLQSFDK